MWLCGVEYAQGGPARNKSRAFPLGGLAVVVHISSSVPKTISFEIVIDYLYQFGVWLCSIECPLDLAHSAA
jgi:hypothetical protein